MNISNKSFNIAGNDLPPLILAFLVGIPAIILPRLLTPESFSLYAAFFSALLAVVIVGLLGWYYTRPPETKDISRAGDDLYYLGLLFTLVSLIYALVSLFIFRAGDADLARRTNELIGNFGIALLSTVAGILGRVILQSMRKPESPEGSAETGLPNYDLHIAARRLRTEMRGASDAFSHYSRMTMLQAEDTKRHAERMAKNLNRRLEETARNAISQTEDAFQKMAVQIQKTIQEAIQETSGVLNRQSDEIAGVLTALVEQLGSANRALAELPASIEQTKRGVNALGETLERQSSESANVLTALVSQVNTTSDSLAELPDNVGRAQRGLDTLGESAKTAIANLDEKAGEIAKAYEAITRNAQKQQEAIAQGLEKAQAASTQMGSEVSGWVQYAEQIRATFEAVNRSLTALIANIERTQRSVDTRRETVESAFDDKIDEVSNACKALAHTAREQQEVMEKILEAVQTASARKKFRNPLHRIFRH